MGDFEEGDLVQVGTSNYIGVVDDVVFSDNVWKIKLKDKIPHSIKQNDWVEIKRTHGLRWSANEAFVGISKAAADTIVLVLDMLSHHKGKDGNLGCAAGAMSFVGHV